MINELTYETPERPGETEAGFIETKLKEYNLLFVPPDGHMPLYIVCRKDGEAVGGLLGGTYWQRMYVRRFWIDARYRQIGLGKAIIGLAERLAAGRGCIFSGLESEIPGALEFYRKQGYREQMELPDFPPGLTSYALVKQLEKPVIEVQNSFSFDSALGKFQLAEDYDADAERLIETELANFIEDSSPNEDSVRLVTLCRSGGKIVGGLSGGTSYRWLAIAYLWVDKTYRGQGIGKRLLAMAEDEARRRGCVHSRVFTHDFQAPEFYLQNSYRCQGVLPDIPPGHEQYCFIKDI